MAQKPGSFTDDGGIWQEVGPRGGKKDNYATVKDNEKLPPTTHKGHEWELINKTPDSKKK
ncbi:MULTISPECIES: hypothetical protein [Yersinia]|uniref:hypothetical protein n=1 Tax=Yersinia TaxID=629 RepID=UPI00061CACB2|nr:MULTISPECIES: hypothetical protein [Yersinia]MBW5875167.1 hypothetical protein [Yersinia enterocolitica]CNE82790.1 Uncharacterised protein [Yersinia bercovieri]HDL8025656.1 hypothetical protein [Yersinia enterocolitica]HDL8055289.1 hypothetical protein [Yersinia enterocolitica]